MFKYQPDNWIIIRFYGDDPHYRVLVGWSGGYTQGDSWRMNSGITKCEDDGDYYNFYGSSGSLYRCHKEAYGLRMNTSYVWTQLKQIHGDKVEFMDEETDWLERDWIIKC